MLAFRNITFHNITMEVLFIYGPAAAGKYTVGLLVSEALAMPLFHNHLVVDAVKSLFDFGTTGFKQLRADMWLDAFAAAAGQQQSFVFTFNPENSVDIDLIKTMTSKITDVDGSVYYIELQCSECQLISRMGADSRHQFGKLTDPHLYQQLKADGCFDFPKFCEPDLALDSGQLTAEESAQVILNWYPG